MRRLLRHAIFATRRVGLLARFSVLSLACLLVLGGYLAQETRKQIRERAIVSAAHQAESIALFTVAHHVEGLDLERGLPAAKVNELDDLLHAGAASSPVVGVRIWSPTGLVAYSDEPEMIGQRNPPGPGLMQAIHGHTEAHLSSQGHGTAGEVIEVYVPLTESGDGTPVKGAFEVYLDYAPLASAIRDDSREVLVALAIGLLALWLALFRIVQGASKRLRRVAAENEYQATHDSLTGLPNREAFYAQAGRALRAARARSGLASVMIVDLDRFKEVNDTLGHHSGDLLLKEASVRLRAGLRDGDVLSRLGGDEFAVLLPDVESAQEARLVAQRVCEALERPFELNDLTVHLEASAGIAMHPDHGDDMEALMQRADVAMYVAKGSTASYELYAARHDRHSPARLALLGELRHALENDEFELHYQPKARLSTGAVEGAEALVRWRHPVRGLVPPDDFIPLAEQTGVIKPLTSWVLDSALGQCRAWRDAGLELNVAVNLSVRNLLDAHLPDSVAELLRRHELPPCCLQLEITESTIVADQVRALDVLARLDRMGVGLSVDDFGTGYSSLAYLKDLPVRELKIDRKFVNNMTEDGDDAFIVRSTIDLGRNLGLQVVAEGVETQAAWDQLAALGCDTAQGYFLSPPLPAAELAVWLAERERALAV